MRATGITCTCSGVSVCVLLWMSQDMSAGKYGMRTQMWSAFERRICSLKVVSLCSKGMSDGRKMSWAPTMLGCCNWHMSSTCQRVSLWASKRFKVASDAAKLNLSQSTLKPLR